MGWAGQKDGGIIERLGDDVKMDDRIARKRHGCRGAPKFATSA